MSSENKSESAIDVEDFLPGYDANEALGLEFTDDKEDQAETGVITQSMAAEEMGLRDEDTEVGVQDGEARFISMEERLSRLGILLQKSKIYADSLLKLIEEKKEAERRKALKKEKLAKRKNLVFCDRKLPSNTSEKSSKRKADTCEQALSKRARLSSLEDAENLQKKLYIPKLNKLTSQIREENGARYFGDQIVNVSQPSLFTGGVLRDYQILGYQWLKVLFTNAVNGILADEMGLGKTIQCIALICQIVKMGFKGPFLVCAPTSTLGNWVNEFKTFAPSLPILLYHGGVSERPILAKYIDVLHDGALCYPVVVTSYEVLIRDRPVLGRHRWEYFILDEGHRIKNNGCRLFRELKQLRFGTKLLLTGTPLQNNLKELWSLLNFIIPEVFDDFEVFESWFDFGNDHGATGLSLDQEERFLTALYEILTPFLLRRVKSDVELDLPPKSEVVVYAPLTKKQERFYEAAVAKTIRSLVGGSNANENDILGSILSDVSNKHRITRSQTHDIRSESGKRRRERRPEEDKHVDISLNNIVMLLRKCCNHPYLIEYPLIPGTNIFKVDEDLIASCGKMMVLDRILPKLKERNHKVLLFSQMVKMLDILEDYLRLRSYKSIRLDGSYKMEERQAAITEFNTNSDLFVFLLSTRAGGLGVNLASADTVIIYDSDWNPQNDLQAQDRCHRIGQTRPVMIYRLVTASSIDQKMVESAAKKRKLEKMVMHESKFKGNLDVELKHKTKIERTQILQMIRSSDFDTVVDCDRLMSEEELEKILDRSSLTGGKQ